MPNMTTSDGTRIFFREYGQGRPVVFLHSMLMSSTTWERSLLRFADSGYRAIAYDRRGHGRSDDSGRGYDFDRLADDLAEILELLDLNDVMLVGHSMSGGEIIRYLGRHGSRRVSRLALVAATAPWLNVDPEIGADLLGRLRDDYGAWVSENAGMSFGDNVPGSAIGTLDREATVREWMSVSRYAARECMRSNLAADFRDEATRIAVPTLIVHGDNDAFAPLEICGRVTAELIPASSLVVYPGAPHMLHLSHTERLNTDLLNDAALD
jgi:non-heme chloroperoxidase